MYRIEYVVGDHWSVIDARDRTVFVGTKQRVENWLDLQENLARVPARRPPQNRDYRLLVRVLRRLVKFD